MKQFWFLLTTACLVWYSTVTVYVAFKGAADIKNMLARLAGKQRGEQ
jgi:GH15 family glucan-1,4-alpha-glucosidase